MSTLDFITELFCRIDDRIADAHKHSQATLYPSEVVEVTSDQTVTLTLSNFDHAPTAYSGGVSLSELVAAGSDYVLTLSPGTYNLVIL